MVHRTSFRVSTAIPMSAFIPRTRVRRITLSNLNLDGACIEAAIPLGVHSPVFLLFRQDVPSHPDGSLKSYVMRCTGQGAGVMLDPAAPGLAVLIEQIEPHHDCLRTSARRPMTVRDMLMPGGRS
jgi:hypothetical protein